MCNIWGLKDKMRCHHKYYKGHIWHSSSVSQEPVPEPVFIESALPTNSILTLFVNCWSAITGCDSGFGHEAAKRLDSLGMHVFAGCLTDTGCRGLKANCSPRLHTLRIDVTDEGSVTQAYQQVKQALPHGTGKYRAFFCVFMVICVFVAYVFLSIDRM